MHLCDLIERQRSSINTRLADDFFKLPLPSGNYADTLLSVLVFMDPHMNGTSSMNVSDA